MRSHSSNLRNPPYAAPLPRPIAAAAFLSLMLFAYVARWAPWDPKSGLMDKSFIDEDPINVAERVAAVHSAKFKVVVSKANLRNLKENTTVKKYSPDDDLEAIWQIENNSEFDRGSTQKTSNKENESSQDSDTLNNRSSRDLKAGSSSTESSDLDSSKVHDQSSNAETQKNNEIKLLRGNSGGNSQSNNSAASSSLSNNVGSQGDKVSETKNIAQTNNSSVNSNSQTIISVASSNVTKKTSTIQTLNNANREQNVSKNTQTQNANANNSSSAKLHFSDSGVKNNDSELKPKASDANLPNLNSIKTNDSSLKSHSNFSDSSKLSVKNVSLSKPKNGTQTNVNQLPNHTTTSSKISDNCKNIFNVPGKTSFSSQPLFPNPAKSESMFQRSLEALKISDPSLSPANISIWKSVVLKAPNPKEQLSCTMKPSSISNPEDLVNRKFFAIISLPEQLSRARVHLAEAIAWAKQLKRVLILPRVSEGAISLFQSAPFCAYFDPSSLSPHLDWVTEDAFLEITKCRNKAPTSTFLCLRNKQIQLEDKPSVCYHDLHPPQIMSIMELTQGAYPNTNNSIIIAGAIRSAAVKDNVTEIHDNIKSRLSKFGSNDLVLFHKGLSVGLSIPKPYVDESLSTLKFSPHLVRKADDLIGKHLNPKFVAAHLRLEISALRKNGLVSEEQMLSCAKGLVLLARQKMVEVSTDKFYLAFDLQMNGTGIRRSQGWNSSQIASTSVSFALRAQQHVISALDAITLDGIVDGDVSSLDVGVSAILDKLICAKADVFIAGPNSCGGGGTFERGIRKYRKGYGKENVFQKWNE